MSVRVYLSDYIKPHKNNPAYKRLIDAFIEYKKTGEPGLLFGRDKITDRPRLAMLEEMKHVHILDEKTFKLEKLYLKTQDKRHSDTMLIYCSGSIFENYYYLIAFIWNDAHKFLENNNSLLWDFAKEAEEFRLKY